MFCRDIGCSQTGTFETDSQSESQPQSPFFTVSVNNSQYAECTGGLTASISTPFQSGQSQDVHQIIQFNDPVTPQSLESAFEIDSDIDRCSEDLFDVTTWFWCQHG